MDKIKIDTDFRRQFCGEFRLTTAEILYHLPDCHGLLQTYLWQDYDIAPRFPVLNQFLQFWTRELEGPLHSVTVGSKEIITPARHFICDHEFTLN